MSNLTHRRGGLGWTSGDRIPLVNKANPWIGALGAAGLGGLLALAGSDGGNRVAGFPVFALCVALAFAIQWLAFVPAYFAQSERYYDLTGSFTFLSLALFALAASEGPDARAVVIAVLVVVWALRLGSFLSARIRRDGFDRRLSRIKKDFAAYLMTWSLQGAWVTVSFAPGLAAITATSRVPADGFLVAGVVLWSLGFAIEVAADQQKRRFRSQAANAEQFIASGLWAWCRHPNYFGEILLWFGIAVAAWPALQGWALLTLAAPLFILLLLTRISGVRMLEASGQRRWGDDPEYQDYLARTPTLIPRRPKRRPASSA